MNEPPAEMNSIPPSFWLGLVQWLWLGALSVMYWLRKPGEDAGKAVGELSKRLSEEVADISARLIEVETHIEHMPTSAELTELKGTVQQIEERTRGLAEGLGAVRASLGRIESHLLNQKGG